MLKPDDHVLEYVDAYVHDALVLPEKRLVAAHCEACPICRVALGEARKRLQALSSLPTIEAPEALIRATQRRIEQHGAQRAKRLRLWLAAAAAILLVLGGMNLYYYNLSAAPYDLRILGQAEWLAGSEVSLRVVFLNPNDGSAYPGAPVEIDILNTALNTAAHLASFSTDRFGSGTVRMKLPDWADGKYPLRVRAVHGGSEESVTETIALHRSWQLMLTSDKPVYQPGDVIHLRSLALARPAGKPVAGQPIAFSIVDPKGNVVFRKRDVTSRFGIAATDCPLATEIIEGQYQVRCELADTKGALGVTVEKYVLPKFKLAVELDQPYYEPGARVRGTIAAHYFFGKPVEGAEVEIEVQAADIGPSKITTTAAKTDASRAAKFEFVLPRSLVSRPQDAGDARFSVVATLRDSAGQKQAATVSGIVTEQPIRIEVIPESGTLVRGAPNRMYFLTTYADGRPAETRISVSGIDREIKTNELGAASIEFTPEGDQVQWLVRASDAAGKNGRRDVTFRCGWPGDGFLVHTDKAVYDGGQTMNVTVLGGGSGPVFVDLVKDGQTVLTDTVPISGGRGQYAIDLPPELFGAVQLCAYRLTSQGTPLVENRVVYIRQANGLKIDAHLDRAEYRPGERAKLTVSVSDPQGKPVAAGVSLAGVDEAVFSVLANAAGMKPAFASLDDELLEPVYAIYGWSPDVQSKLSAGGRDELEQALFAKAAQSKTDRDEKLKEVIQKYGENDQRLLDVLQRPDWEQLAENMPDVQKYIPLLRRDGTTLAFQDSSYQQKSHEVGAVRAQRLEFLTAVWIGIGILGGAIALTLIARATGHPAAFFVLVGLALLLSALLLPATQSAREAANRQSKANDIRQIGLALHNYESGKQKDAATDSAPRANEPSSPPPARVREWFPETLLWRPELVTDESGKASLEIDLADSITTWRVSASAVSADGKLGASQSSLRVFQPFFVEFNLPIGLTRGDEVAAPAVVYNYLDKPLTVELRLDDADWFERLDPPVQKLELPTGAVRTVSYRIRARHVGKHELTLHAAGGGVADAIKRSIEVTPNGRRIEQTASGTLQQPAEIAWSVPRDAIEGSVKANVKIYPSTFSQLVDGLEGIFQRPYGCFEQTSSTTYPNVLALDYLRRTKKSVPKVEATAREYINLGYQRLLSFEIAGGGFDWFGRPPANRVLTAYGLMEFSDMVRVSDVDPQLIERTRGWLLDQQNDDGSWSPDRNGIFHDDPTRAAGDLDQLSTTAYIAWAVFADGHADSGRAQRTMTYLLHREPDTIDDPYVLALVANALSAMRPNNPALAPYLRRLDDLCHRSPDGKLAWWEQGASRRTMFYGEGRGGSVETTALAALAMMQGRTDTGTVRGALAWLISQKDSHGTWYSTQATVLALKALLAGTDRPLGDARERRIDVAVDGKTIQSLVIPADQDEVVQQLDLSPQANGGDHRLTITERTDSAAGYQATLVYYTADAAEPLANQPLAIQLDYDKTSLAVNDTVKVTARVTNRIDESAPMVMLDLPIPAGFAIEADDLEALRLSGKIGKFQLTARSAIVYLRELKPSESLELSYRLRAVMPVKITAPAARVYEYYNPDRQAATAPVALTVSH
jgi:alpha-2-macroglobulin-like protein